ncbi:MAG: GH92 family glycosyl hydrolase [Bacteroidales bacterium]|nr:GH92 family glycosyl hydrolase [Bacteroidales bacterium]
MKKSYLLLLPALLLLYACQGTEDWIKDPVTLVNPLMGTASSYEFSAGNTYPAIGVPWGMHTWTPQTGRNGDGWTYTYDAHKLVGFKQTHQPSPWINDYGCFSLFPVSGERPGYTEEERASWFSHKAERATPYEYSVYLAEYDIEASFSPTSRACIFRIRYPSGAPASLIVDVMDRDGQTRKGHIRVDTVSGIITGYSVHEHGGTPDNFKNYFIICPDCDIKDYKLFDDGTCRITFLLSADKPYWTVEIRVASSFISPEQAALNLSGELDGKDYETVCREGKATWNKALSRIEIAGGTRRRQETFYSCLYRSLLFPRSLYEYDSLGTRIHYSPYNGQIARGYMFTDTGFWDTFRCLFPLLNLLYPSENLKMQEGLVNAWLESGFLPEWASPGHRGCMVGNNSASVVTDGYLKRLNWLEDSLGYRPEWPRDKELTGYRIDELYKALLKASEQVHPTVSSTGRLGHEYYNSIGYIPYDVGIDESVARTLEYAYNDWCNARLAESLGAPQDQIETFSKRAGNYRNVFDKEHLLMRGRNLDGSFQTPYNPYKWGDAFTEGNAWHYTWSVFHDMEGLIGLMGGKDAFTRMLDSVFVVPPVFDCSYYGGIIHEIREMQVMNMGNYAHGNQPAQHMIYLYNLTDKPRRTGELAHWVMDRFYSPAPDGYCGDEDNGQTSAWYVFSAIGFYPVCPGSDRYEPGFPLFNKIRLHLENGRTIVITPSEESYPQLKINGRVPEKITHRELIMR